MDENFSYQLSCDYQGKSSPRFATLRAIKFFWHMFNSFKSLKSFDIEECLKVYSKMIDCLGNEKTDDDFREFKEKYLFSARKMLSLVKDYHEGRTTESQFFSEIESIPNIEKQSLSSSYYIRLNRKRSEVECF